MIGEGALAPDFELQADSGDVIRLRDFRGSRVVLYFYPKDGTSGCTTEACGFRDVRADIEEQNAVILGVSPDGVQSHSKFRAEHDLHFPLLADADHRVATAYGAWGKKKLYGREYEGILRSTFVIDENGRVERVYSNVKPAGHAERVLADLRG